MKHIDNMEAVLFAHQNLQTSNEITFKWVMQDYLKMFRIGKGVYSPIFHTKMGGYSFQLIVEWSGLRKEKLALYFKLHRGETLHRFLEEFNTELTLRIHGKNDTVTSNRFTQEGISKLRDNCFSIKKGDDSAESGAGVSPMLIAPYDDFIVNNSLIISCTLYL